MDRDVTSGKSARPWRNGHARGAMLLVLGLCALIQIQFGQSARGQSDQRSAVPAPPFADQNKAPESKPPAPSQKDPSPTPKPKGDEGTEKPAPSQKDLSPTPKPKGEDGTEKNETAKKTLSSLILTVKLALLADPRLFPYEIEVEDASNEVTLSGKAPTDREKSVAAEVARAVPTVKSVVNKIEVAKDLPELLARRQDDIITRHVIERFAKSATLKAAGFDVKTEQGIVLLSGAVRFQVIILEAAEAARQVPGVKAVKTDKVRIESEG